MSVHTGRNATVVMDSPPVAYVKVFRKGGAPDGWILRKAHVVAATARVLAPARTYALRNSIRVQQNRTEDRSRFAIGYQVSANTPYAYYVHEGTSPHVYFSYPNAMRFPGTNAYEGQIVFTDMVNHPGNKAQPFLQEALARLKV